VPAEGHPLTIWVKRPEAPRAAILLVHGRRFSGRPNFDLQVPGERRSLMDALFEHGYASHALDMRGYGGTPRDRTGWLTPERAASDVAAVLDWIARNERTSGAVRPVLLGYSRGSQVSLLCAQRYPERLSALILFGFGRDLDEPFPATPDPPLPGRIANTVLDASADFITPEAISKAAVAAYVREALATDSVAMDWARMHEFNATDPAQVKVPTLLLQCERDPRATTVKQTKLFSRLGTSDRMWMVMAGCDHAGHVEDSQPALVHAIASFLERPARRVR
jgi:pimeloyl-ACP methyl ester carboxylesterase